MHDVTGCGRSGRLTGGFTAFETKKNKYDDYCEEKGLGSHLDRTQVYGYDRSKSAKTVWAERKAEKTYKMAGKPNDWRKALPTSHSQADLDALEDYANGKNVIILNTRKYDGDIDLLKEQIDIISELKTEFKIDENINIQFKNMNDSGFAETNGHTISYNKNVLRNRAITDSNLEADGYLAAFDTSGITVHEIGHILTKKYNLNGLDIFKESYYNLYNTRLTTAQAIKYLNDYVSDYSTELQIADKSLKSLTDKIYYNVITSEMLVMYKSFDADLAKEFVRLIKGVIK